MALLSIICLDSYQMALLSKNFRFLKKYFTLHTNVYDRDGNKGILPLNPQFVSTKIIISIYEHL